MPVVAQMALSQAMLADEPEVVEAALAALVHEHSRFLFRVAYAVLRNHHDAEDAVQETFLRVLRRPRELKDVRDPRAWLARIAWRIALDRCRFCAVRREIADPETAMAELRSFAATAEQVVAGGQMLAIAGRMMAALPAALQDVLRLSSIGEMTSAEMSVVLGIPEATVRTRLFRARQLLKDKMVAYLKEKLP